MNNDISIPRGNRPYRRMEISSVMLEQESPVLAESVVRNSKIQSVGHETGVEVDFSQSSFNHEWIEGTE